MGRRGVSRGSPGHGIQASRDAVEGGFVIINSFGKTGQALLGGVERLQARAGRHVGLTGIGSILAG